jgi:hypothetical protein
MRILFVLDPRRIGYLMLGSDKTWNSAWYTTFTPIAEKIYGKH